MTTTEEASEDGYERRAHDGSSDLEGLPLGALVALVAGARLALSGPSPERAMGAARLEARARHGAAPPWCERATAPGATARASKEVAAAFGERGPNVVASTTSTLVASGVDDAPATAVRLAELARSSAQRIAVHFGLDEAAAQRVAAAFELGRRVERSRRDVAQALRAPSAVHELMLPELRGVQRECFHVLLLDGKHRLKRRERISEGTLTQSLVHPREVFGPALRECAAALIVVHNHPSGDPEPSREDLLVTRRLIETGEILGIPLLDHVVIADESYVSLRERMKFA